MLVLLPPASAPKAQETTLSVEDQIRLLTTGTPEQAKAAGVALQRIGAPAVQPLIKALKEAKDYETRDAIASALGAIGEKATPAVATLIATMLDTQDDDIAYALAAIGAPAVQPLIKALNEAKDFDARGAIAEALGFIGKPAVAPLIAELKATRNFNSREDIVYALVLVQKPAVQPLIAELNATSDDRTRGAIALALGGLKEAAALTPLITELKSALDDHDDERVRATASALGAMGKTAAPAVQPLVGALNEAKHDPIRSAVASALGKIGEEAAPAVGPLVNALRNTQDGLTRGNMAYAINQIASAYYDTDVQGGNAAPNPNLLAQLKDAEAAAEEFGVKDRTEAVRFLIDRLHSVQPTFLERMSGLAWQNPYYVGLLFVLILWLCGWLLLFAVRPLLFHEAALWTKKFGMIKLGPYEALASPGT